MDLTEKLLGDKIDMHYRGTLQDTGAEFDASVRPSYQVLLTATLADIP